MAGAVVYPGFPVLFVVFVFFSFRLRSTATAASVKILWANDLVGDINKVIFHVYTYWSICLANVVFSSEVFSSHERMFMSYAVQGGTSTISPASRGFPGGLVRHPTHYCVTVAINSRPCSGWGGDQVAAISRGLRDILLASLAFVSAFLNDLLESS